MRAEKPVGAPHQPAAARSPACTPTHRSSARRMKAASFSTSRMNRASEAMLSTCSGAAASSAAAGCSIHCAALSMLLHQQQPPPPAFATRQQPACLPACLLAAAQSHPARRRCRSHLVNVGGDGLAAHAHALAVDGVAVLCEAQPPDHHALLRCHHCSSKAGSKAPRWGGLRPRWGQARRCAG